MQRIKILSIFMRNFDPIPNIQKSLVMFNTNPFESKI